MKEKYVKDSLSTETLFVFYDDANAAGFLFGGKYLSIIDKLSGICGVRHSEGRIVTASMVNNFLKPAKLGDVITFIAKVVYTGTSSFVVKVEAYKDVLGKDKELIDEAYATMVAVEMDSDKTRVVPKLIVENEEQQKDWDKALEVLEALKKTR